MQRKSIGITLALVLLMVAPSALSTYRVLGTQEPDTTYDLQGYMFAEPPQLNGEASAFLSVVPINQQGWLNPNVGAVGSRILPPGNLRFDAFFGVWRDCNKDGYVGNVETALFEYPSALLRTSDVCPLTPTGQGRASLSDGWNEQGWVTEFRFFANYWPPGSYGGFDGNNDGVPDGRDKRSIWDFGANVWGDFGVPGDTMGREVCPRDLTRGTTHRAGAFLNWADCFTRHKVWETADPALDNVGLGWSETWNFDERGHPLNLPLNDEANFGRNHGDDAVVHAFDCSNPPAPIQTGQARTGTEYNNVTIGTLSPGRSRTEVIDSDGHLNVSVWTYPETSNGETRTFNSEPRTPRMPNTSPSLNSGGSIAGTYNATNDGDCNPSTGSGMYGIGETTAQAERANAKNRVTMRFAYFEEQRGGSNQRGPVGAGAPLPAIYPVIRSGALVLWDGSTWYSSGNAPSELGAAGPTPPHLIRSDLSPEGAIYWTFYANLTSQSLSLSGLSLPGAAGTYGAEWCARSPDPALNGGFVCDGSKWYVLDDGTPQTGATVDWSPRPGTLYHLRDTDCYDGEVVRGTGARASLVDFSGRGNCG